MAEVKRARPDISYYYGEVNTPFQRPGQQWDFCLGYWRALAAKWRVVCLSLLLLNALLVFGFFSLLRGPQQQVWVVQSNHSGFVERSGFLNLNTPVPTAAAKHVIDNYLSNVK